MGKQRSKIGKYNKISLQKKFQLLKLVHNNNFNLRETCKLLQINYSTAKTILFQYQKKKIRNPLTFFEKKCKADDLNFTNIDQEKVANYKLFNFSLKQINQVKVICSLNGKKNEAKQKIDEFISCDKKNLRKPKNSYSSKQSSGSQSIQEDEVKQTNQKTLKEDHKQQNEMNDMNQYSPKIENQIDIPYYQFQAYYNSGMFYVTHISNYTQYQPLEYLNLIKSPLTTFYNLKLEN